MRSTRIVRVIGERQLPHNKGSRCNRAFQIPQNCKIDKIHAKWQEGTLIITFPKETITQPLARKEEPKAAQEAPKAAFEPKSPKDIHLIAASPKATAEPKSSKDYQQAADKEAKYSKDRQAAPGKAAATSVYEKQSEVKKDASATATSSIDGEKKTARQSIDALSAEKSEKEAKLQKDTDRQEASTFPKAASTTTTSMKQKDKGSSLVTKAETIDQMTEKERREAIENTATESKKPEHVKERTAQVKESAFPKTSGKEEKSVGEEKQKEKKSITAAAAMKALKGLSMEQNEDKQLLINVGVAALLLVALGAYVSYSIGSKSKV